MIKRVLVTRLCCFSLRINTELTLVLLVERSGVTRPAVSHFVNDIRLPAYVVQIATMLGKMRTAVIAIAFHAVQSKPMGTWPTLA